MAGLTVYKDNGQMLFDTTKISYGLVKSGYMTFQQSWSRRQLRSAQLNPTEGANWSPVQNVAQDKGDNLFGFTLSNARNPIVFLVGSGTLNGSQRAGNNITFLYSNSTAETRYYCFDLMADNIAGTTFLKIYNDDRTLTFNSLQPPLNVVGQYTAPPPDPRTQAGRYFLLYQGGRTQRRQLRMAPDYRVPQADCIFDVPLASGVEYAAFLPWSRGSSIMDFNSGYQGDAAAYAVLEGAYGRTGGISFMFGASAGTTDSRAMAGGGVPAGISYGSVAIDRFPTALIIQTAALPLPYG
ncbi:hypothetical protein [Pseudomonas paraglycinae]|uniref:hypothetical protein n=1 Tax=Pseudomonas paraglycinae TaxID=2892330 RepID=UPI001F19D2E7|nr:hypothetical protein [Pseudomonas paraglycinae]